MKTTEQGRSAEAAVAERLKKSGYKIINRNWRNRLCEIDIIAENSKIIYFIEVKYRANMAQGSGFEYITPNKFRQMSFAAENWVAQNNWSGDYRLMAAAVSGPKNEQIEIIEL